MAAGSLHGFSFLVNPSHTLVVRDDHTPPQPSFQLRTAPQEPDVLSKLGVRQRIFGAGANLVSNPALRQVEALGELLGVQMFVAKNLREFAVSGRIDYAGNSGSWRNRMIDVDH